MSELDSSSQIRYGLGTGKLFTLYLGKCWKEQEIQHELQMKRPNAAPGA